MNFKTNFFTLLLVALGATNKIQTMELHNNNPMEESIFEETVTIESLTNSLDESATNGMKETKDEPKVAIKNETDSELLIEYGVEYEKKKFLYQRVIIPNGTIITHVSPRKLKTFKITPYQSLLPLTEYFTEIIETIPSQKDAQKSMQITIHYGDASLSDTYATGRYAPPGFYKACKKLETTIRSYKVSTETVQLDQIIAKKLPASRKLLDAFPRAEYMQNKLNKRPLARHILCLPRQVKSEAVKEEVVLENPAQAATTAAFTESEHWETIKNNVVSKTDKEFVEKVLEILEAARAATVFENLVDIMIEKK